MPRKTLPHDELPYDDSDPESIIKYAGRLTNHKLNEFLDMESGTIGGTNAKGKYGQIVEKGYFFIDNNNDAVPDFDNVGIELKVTPIIKGKKGAMRSKERLVLGIIDYNEVLKKGFRVFLDKNEHLLIVFYLWTENTDVGEYRILKVADWVPSEEELRVIREDWDIIEGFVERGEAHLLSERCTRFLAATTKGAGHDKDYRTQPNSDEPAKQRALSFKSSFMTVLFNTLPDVNEMLVEQDGEYGTLFQGEWGPDTSFTDYILEKLDRFSGKTCGDIELELGINLNSPKQYYSMLAMAMFGIVGKKHVKELEEAGITMKTVRVKHDGTPEEDMSFPTFDPDVLVEQTWEESDFLEQLYHEFLIIVFGFNTDHPDDEKRKDLVFKGAFFWCVPDNDLKVIEEVWQDTRQKIIEGRSDFIKKSDRRISHVRPHDSRKVVDENGKDVTRKCFWLNSGYIKEIVRSGLSRRYSGQRKL